MTAQTCGVRTGWGRRSKNYPLGLPRFCEAPATVTVDNRQGLRRLYCEAHLVEYRNEFDVTGAGEFARRFTVTPLKEVS